MDRGSLFERSQVFWAVTIFSLLLALASVLMRNSYAQDLLVNVFLWTAMAGAWNLTGGYAGQFSLGHAAFFGIGAYTSTLLFLNFHLSPWLGMLAGAVAAALLSLTVGYLSIRLGGAFFTLATIGLAESLQRLVVFWRDLTHGGAGLLIPFDPGWRNFVFSSKVPFVFLTFTFMFGVLLLAKILERSRLGYTLLALREDEEEAVALGINPLRTKLWATALSASLMAIAGTLYAQYVLWLEPTYAFGLELSVEVGLIAIIGGLGSSVGPLLGGLLIIPLKLFLRGLLGDAQSGVYLVIYGLALIVVVRAAPSGAFGVLQRKLRRAVPLES